MAVVSAVVVAGRELRRLDRLAASERLTRVVEQLEGLVSLASQQRAELKRQAAAHPAIQAFLRGHDVDSEQLADALAPLSGPSDAGLPVQIWSREGVVVYSDLPYTPQPERAPRPHVPLDSIPTYGAFHQRGDDIYYYSTAPVVHESRVLGWVVQLRRIGSPAAAAQFQPLIGEQARVLFHYPGDSLWITLAGEAVPAPIAHAPWDSTIVYARDGVKTLVRARQVRGAPWSVLVEMPDGVIGGGGRFTARMLAAGVLLIAAAVIAALLLSRRLTRGLRQLASAAAALASGNYAARAEAVSGGEEMDRLAAAFNSMAEQVSHSHRALEARLREARVLTQELSTANVQAEEARARAESADRAKSDFLATMSHEIRTPINAVLGFCQVLELEDLPREKRQEYLYRTQRAARQLAALVEDVLDLSKIQSGAITINACAAPVRPAVDAATAIVSEAAGRKQIALEIAVPEDLIATADPQRLQQILLNLLSNAVKFTPERGRVRVHARQHNGAGRGTITVVVEDTGIGIDADQLERIFEPFVQGHTGYTREFGGTGLGLSISRRLAHLMNGELVVESMPGAGSRFTLTLPAATVAHAGS